jgi:hypothetical protein
MPGGGEGQNRYRKMTRFKSVQHTDNLKQAISEQDRQSLPCEKLISSSILKFILHILSHIRSIKFHAIKFEMYYRQTYAVGM